jgi:hypothetical protein
MRDPNPDIGHAGLAAFYALAPVGADPIAWADSMRLAYIARPAPAVIAGLYGIGERALRGTELEALSPMQPAADVPPSQAASALIDAVAVYVRHGDKHTEMRLIDAAAYMRIAAPIAKSINSRQPTIFLGTDDKEAIEIARQALAASNVVLLWARDLPRTSSNPGLPGISEYGKARTELEEAGFSMAMLIRAQYVELLRAVGTRTWVGTLKSNICRFINTLRCAWNAGGGRLANYTDITAQDASGSFAMNVQTASVPCWTAEHRSWAQ